MARIDTKFVGKYKDNDGNVWRVYRKDNRMTGTTEYIVKKGVVGEGYRYPSIPEWLTPTE